MARMPQEKALALNAHCTLGRAIEKAAKAKLVDFKSLLDTNYKWLEEILDVAKQTFARPHAELLPKTPSSKRARATLRKRRSRQPQPIAEEDESEDDYVPKKKRSRKMPVRSSSRLQKTTQSNARPATRSSSRRNNQATTDFDSSRSEEPIFSICRVDIHSSNDSEPHVQSPRPHKQQRFAVITTDSDGEKENEGGVKSTIADSPKGHSSAMQTDSSTSDGQHKSSRLSASSPSSMVVDSGTDEEHHKFMSPVTGHIETSSPSVSHANKGVSSCPKLEQRLTVSLGHRCSGDAIQNLSAHAPSPHSVRGFGLLTVKDKVNVIEGKLDAGAVAVVVAAVPPHTAPSKSPRTPDQLRGRRSNHSSSAGQTRRSCRGGPRVSLSKSRRSSAYRQKLSRLSAVAGRSVQEVTTTLTKVRPIMSPRKAVTSVLGKIQTPETNRCTRSKMRAVDRLHAVQSPCDGSSDSSSAAYTPVKPVRTGRPKAVMTTPSEETEAATRKDDHTATCIDSGSEEPLKPIRTTRAAAQKSRQKAEDIHGGNETGKRPVSAEQHHGRSFSAPKRQCTDTRNEHISSEERVHRDHIDSVIADTPSPILTAKKAVSQLRHHNRLRTTPGHNTSAVTSFIRRNTPLKSQLDMVELKRQELATKDQQNTSRLQKRQELMQKRTVEQRKRREEKQLLAAQRREERERTMREMRLDMVQRSVEKSNRTNQSYAMRLREERRELREKKMADVEQRRRQEDEARKHKLATLEEEQRKHEELKRRQRDYEEQERLRRIADQERQRLQRQQELEQEQRRLAERQRQLEAERAREEQERQRLREEREKERVERERQELERQREKEECRQEELKRMREQERLKNELKREEERTAQEAEKRLRHIIDKHNTNLQAKTTINTSVAASSTQGKSRLLNTSYTVVTDQHVAPPKQPETNSYEMTPPVKKYHAPSSSENYNIDNINSEDSTDDEGAPKKKIPSWAVGAQLKAGLVNQHHRPPDLDTIFDIIDPPDLNVLFAAKRKPRFNKRTSSAVWHSPIYTAGGRC